MQPEILQLGESLRGVMASLLRQCGGAPERPMSIVKALGVDKTLASRSAKASRATDPLSALLASPAPAGLEVMAAAAERAGVAAETVAEFRAVIARFNDMIASFPGGRSGMDSMLAGWLPEEREGRSRAARQMVHKGMASLLNVTVDTAYTAYFFTDSGDGKHYDGAFMNSQQGLRRLRHGFPILIGGVSLDDAVGQRANRCALDGTPMRDDPSKAVLRQFCRGGGAEAVKLIQESPTAFSMVVGENDPPLNTPATITFGALSRAVGPSRRSAGVTHDFMRIRVRKPTTLLVLDLFVQQGLFVSSLPKAECSLVGGVRMPEASARGTTYDEIDVPLDILSLGKSTGGVHAAGVEGVPNMVKYMLDQMGRSPAEFELHRLRLEYPVPTAELMCWFELKE
jgi:hypothetical protein